MPIPPCSWVTSSAIKQLQTHRYRVNYAYYMHIKWLPLRLWQCVWLIRSANVVATIVHTQVMEKSVLIFIQNLQELRSVVNNTYPLWFYGSIVAVSEIIHCEMPYCRLCTCLNLCTLLSGSSHLHENSAIQYNVLNTLVLLLFRCWLLVMYPGLMLHVCVYIQR